MATSATNFGKQFTSPSAFHAYALHVLAFDIRRDPDKKSLPLGSIARRIQLTPLFNPARLTISTHLPPVRYKLARFYDLGSAWLMIAYARAIYPGFYNCTLEQGNMFQETWSNVERRASV